MSQALEAQLAALDTALAARPDHAELHYHRGAVLAQLGRSDAARDAFLAALSLEPSHFGALNDLGTLLYTTDYRSAAQLVYAEAVRYHPEKPAARVNLANALLAADDLGEARRQFEAALRLEPDHPDAHQGLANLLQQIGEAEAAERHRRRSYDRRGLLQTPYQGEGAPCRVLVLASAAGGNVPTRFLLPPERFETTTLAAEAFTAATSLPAHEVVFNAIGDADLAPDALEAAERVLACTTAPVINPPARVRRTDRASNARRLARLEGVRSPRVERVARTAVSSAADGFGYPLLLRSPGYHTGQHFTKVEHPADLNAFAAALPGPELLMIEYLDARDAAGRARKYRVMTIGGVLFPLHLAVSNDWKVHYFTSAMADEPALRSEEEAFLNDMAGVLGPTVLSALDRIRDTLDLDYAGIDFALAADGQLLLFEANATMVIPPPASDAMWNYRRAPTFRVLEAAQTLVMQRSGRP